MRKILLLFIFQIICLSLTAQTTVNVDKHIGIENGLTNNFVVDLTIDKRGHVWVATESGFNRVAGNIVTTFRRHNITKETFPKVMGNSIRSLYYDKQTDKVIIGMENGMSIYDCKQAIFKHFSSQEGPFHTGINDIIKKSDGEAWLLAVDGSVWQIDCQSYEIKELPIDTLRGIRCGYDDGNGHLFLGLVSEGLAVVDINTGKSQHFIHREGVLNSLPGDNVRCVFQDDMKNIWVGTDHGVALFNYTKGVFTKVTHTGTTTYDNVYNIK